MSRNEWESGTVKLPTGEFPKVRKAMEDADRKAKTAHFERAQAFWKGLPAKAKRDIAAYEQAARDHCFAPARQPTTWNPNPPLRCGLSSEEASALHDMLMRGTRERTEPGRWGARAAKPRRILRDDIDWPTNRTTAFRVDGDTTITFDRDTSTVTWDVRENNHAVDDARAAPLAGAFFGALDKVVWTRGTGGVFVGNDEYNEEAGRDYPGGGGSYTTAGFGPIGAEQAPGSTGKYRTAKGVVDPLDRLAGRSGRQGRVSRGVPAGGQFTGRSHSEASIRL